MQYRFAFALILYEFFSTNFTGSMSEVRSRPSVWWSLTAPGELLAVIRLRSLWKLRLKLREFSVTKLFSGLVRFVEFITPDGYANMKLVADIKIILYSFPGERIVILEAYRRRRLHLRHFLTDVKKQKPDVEFCLNEDKLVIDGQDVSYCEETHVVCIQTQNIAAPRWTQATLCQVNECDLFQLIFSVGHISVAQSMEKT